MIDRPTAPLTHAVADLVAHGVALGVAADAIGLDRGAVREWLTVGRQRPGTPCARFGAAIEHARTERAQTLLMLVERGRARVNGATVAGVTDDELPVDPDWDHVPEPVRQADGQTVYLTDRDTGEVLSGMLAVSPGVFGDIARAEADE